MILGLICIVMYLATTGIIASRLFHHLGPQPKVFAVPAFVALAFHLYLISNGLFMAGGENMSMLNVASIIAWLITITMTLASFSLPTTILMPVVYGFSALVVLLTLVIPDSYIMHIELRPALLVHITLALFAYGCLSIAVLFAFQVAYINSTLKQKKATILHSSLPPLMTVETIFFKLLLTGTVLLTFSLLSGFAFLDNMLAKEQAHKTVLSCLAWLVFCITLIGHNRWGWRGRPVIVATVSGATLLTLAYFGSRFVREVILNG